MSVTNFEIYKGCRDYIVSLDEIIASRIGWSLTINSVAMTGFIAGSGIATDRKLADFAVVLICAFMAVVNIWFFMNVRSNIKTACSIGEAYELYRAKPENADLLTLPQVTYGFRTDVSRSTTFSFTRLSNILIMLALVWCGLAGLTLWGPELVADGAPTRVMLAVK